MELLEQFAAGELEAFETLFRQWQGEVYRWIVRMVRHPVAAEDLTVETFWRIWKARARFDPAREFGPWARRIATNVTLDHLKTARPEVALAAQRADGPPVQWELRDAVERAFHQLPLKLRAVATLALIEGRTNEEIAAALGISAGAVKTRAFRATRMLRTKLGRMGIKA